MNYCAVYGTRPLLIKYRNIQLNTTVKKALRDAGCSRIFRSEAAWPDTVVRSSVRSYLKGLRIAKMKDQGPHWTSVCFFLQIAHKWCFVWLFLWAGAKIYKISALLCSALHQPMASYATSVPRISCSVYKHLSFLSYCFPHWLSPKTTKK